VQLVPNGTIDISSHNDTQDNCIRLRVQLFTRQYWQLLLLLS